MSIERKRNRVCLNGADMVKYIYTEVIQMKKRNENEPVFRLLYDAPAVRPAQDGDQGGADTAGDEYPANFIEPESEQNKPDESSERPKRPPMMQAVYAVSFPSKPAEQPKLEPIGAQRRLERTKGFCSACGTPLPMRANYCPNCGQKVARPTREPGFVCVYAAPGYFKKKNGGDDGGDGPNKPEEV